MRNSTLLQLGFVDKSYEDEGEHFKEFELKLKNCSIVILGETVEIQQGNSVYVEVPNCKYILDLKNLIKLFK
jgi:hypothetical protein